MILLIFLGASAGIFFLLIFVQQMAADRRNGGREIKNTKNNNGRSFRVFDCIGIGQYRLRAHRHRTYMPISAAGST